MAKFMNLKRGISKVGFQARKHSPLILLLTSIGLGIGTGVLVYQARPKVEKIVEKIEDDRANGLEVDRVELAKDLSKALALPIATGTLAIVAVAGSYRILNRRIVTLASVLATTQATQKAFEDKFRKKFGETAYNEFVTTKEVITKELDEAGEEVEVKNIVRNDLDLTYGDFFSNSCESYKDDMSYNNQFIDDVVRKLDLRMFAKGTLLLNEVRDALGLDTIKNGALLGWTSAGDMFDIEKIPHIVEDPETHQFVNDIYLKWTTPKYVYDQIDYGF